MTSAEALSASMEDYLEAIFHVVAEKQAARAKDIAKRLGVNNSSVTGALRALSDKGLINYAPYDVITLTREGNKLATEIVRKHEVLQNFFVKVLRVNRNEAEDAACKIEHAVSRTILDRIIQFTHFLDVCPRGGETWIKGFWDNCESNCQYMKPYENCEECISLCLEDFRKKKREMDTKETGLNEMDPGQKGKILKIKGRTDIKKRMAEMGLTPGNIIEVEETLASSDSIDIKVEGYHRTISKEDALRIRVELFI
ncbi:MAG: metal-dependent transcriptional regulator [Desulfobacterales bacterium]|nr:metal-dependent transcriptional regulator [Desulfobacterales bacterium]